MLPSPLLTRSPCSYDAVQYARFRDCDLVGAALELATAGRFLALRELFVRHPETLPFRLAILATVPETADPSEYADLLPATPPSPQEGEGEDAPPPSHRQYYWQAHGSLHAALVPYEPTPSAAESGALLARAGVVTWEADTGAPPDVLPDDFHRSQAPTSATDIARCLSDAFATAKLLHGLGSAQLAEWQRRQDVLACWYTRRARRVDHFAGQLQHAVTTARLGLLRLGVALKPMTAAPKPGATAKPPPSNLPEHLLLVPPQVAAAGPPGWTQTLFDTYVGGAELHRLVFECDMDSSLSLAAWLRMDARQRMELMLADAAPETIVPMVRGSHAAYSPEVSCTHMHLSV